MSDDHLRLTEKDTICPHCHAEYRSLSRHWGHKSSHRPAMDYLQHSIAAGLVLGGCKIDADGQTPALDIRTQYPTFAVWLYENLGWLANTIHRAAPGERQHSPTYIVRTVPHPEFDYYRRWRAGDDHPSAAETIYSPYTLRVWVAKTAGAGWSGPTHSRTTRFHAETDARHRWYGAVLDYLGYEPYDSGVRYELDQSESRDLFERIGGPVPGVGHKWEFDKADYETFRREQWVESQLTTDSTLVEGALGPSPRATDRKYPERDVILALREAATDGMLGIEDYRNWRSSVTAETPSLGFTQRYMRWSVWKSLAGLKEMVPDRWTKTACLTALAERYGSADALPDSLAYQHENTDDEGLPSQTRLYLRFGSWDTLRAEIAGFIADEGPSREPMPDTEECPRCGARTTVEPHFPKGAVGQENRTALRGCHACGWHENQ